MAERSRDWLNQALRDFEVATAAFKSGYYEWACFIYQQSAEKALKAVFQKRNAEARGHSIYELLKGLKDKFAMDEINDSMETHAKILDRYYIPARYPNSWPAGYPGEFITKDDAEGARTSAEVILKFCQGRV